MRLMLAGMLATLTAASLAIIRPALLTEDEREATQSMRESRWRADVRFLSSDLLEGRAPGTRGEQLAREYIAARFEAIGLEPGAQGGAWEQPFELVGVRLAGPARAARDARQGRASTLRSRTTTSPGAAAARSEARLDDAEIVFVGYGIVAPEYAVGRLQGRGPARARCCSDDEQRPRGRPRALRRQDAPLLRPLGLQVRDRGRGAAPPARSSSTRRRRPATPGRSCRPPGRASSSSCRREGGPQLQVKAWATEEACAPDRAPRRPGPRRAARRAPQKRDFRPVPLGVSAQPRARERGRSASRRANVIGRLPGRDPQLAKEAVHLHRPPRPPRDASRRPSRRGRDLQRRPRQRLRRRRAARRRRGLRRAARSAPRRIDPLRVGRRRGAGAARLAVPRRAPAGAGRAASPPTSTSTASTSGAARATSR